MKIMKNPKKYLSLILFFVIVTQTFMSLPASAVKKTEDLPNEYWALQREYSDAVSKGDNRGIITAVQKIYDLFVGKADPAATADKWLKNGDVIELDIINSRLLKASEAALALDDRPEILRLHKLFLIFTTRWMMTVDEKAKSDNINFRIPATENIIAAYTVNPMFFTEIPFEQALSYSYTGAKFEPKNGIYYGSPEAYSIGSIKGNPLIEKNPKKPSGSLVYLNFSQNISDFDWYFKELVKKVDVIHLAWNMNAGNPNADLKSVSDSTNSTKKIEDTADYLSGLKIPVLLRFSSEMNIWSTPASADEFKSAFIKVSDIMHKRAPNVAMVFSPNDFSAAGKTITEYYPGDKYVDWVGVSNYYEYYKSGNKNTSDFNSSLYGTKDYANSINRLKEIVGLFGGKKPIMLSEYGVSNYYPKLGEYTTTWASYRLSQLMYYIPMVYPEIKAMFYFDADRTDSSGAHTNYAIRSSNTMNELYNKLTDNFIYMPAGKQTADKTYEKLAAEGTVVNAQEVIINTYAEIIKYPELTVTYSIGGKEYAKTTKMPYRAVLDLSGLKDGKYNIEVVVKSSADNKQHVKKTLAADKKGAWVIIYDNSIKTGRKIAEIPVATPTPSKVYVNGVEKTFEAYNINGSNYFKLRDLAYVLNGTEKQFDVGWDGAKNAISLTSNTPYKPNGSEMSGKSSGKTTPYPTKDKIYLDGKETWFMAYKINGNNFLKLRDVMQAFDVYVGYDDKTKAITLDTSKSYTAP